MKKSQITPEGEKWNELNEKLKAAWEQFEAMKEPVPLPSSFKETYMFNKDHINLLVNLPFRWYEGVCIFLPF